MVLFSSAYINLKEERVPPTGGRRSTVTRSNYCNGELLAHLDVLACTEDAEKKK